jgi:hypothetical protein
VRKVRSAAQRDDELRKNSEAGMCEEGVVRRPEGESNDAEGG